MKSFESIIDELIVFLKGKEVISSGSKILPAYIPSKLPNPLRSIYIVVKPEKLTVEKNEEEGVKYDKVVKFTVGISIRKSERENPAELLAKFTAILNALEKDKGYNVLNAGFKEMKRDADSNSVVLPCYITVKMYY